MNFPRDRSLVCFAGRLIITVNWLRIIYCGQQEEPATLIFVLLIRMHGTYITTKNEWNAQNAIWSDARSDLLNLFTGVLTIYHVKRTQWAALQQERFDLPSLTPALCNLRLLPLKLMSQQIPGNISFARDHINVAQQWILPHSSSKIVGLVGPNKRKTNGLLEHCKCRPHSGNLSILAIMYCNSQHSWVLLHPFSNHCQHNPTTTNILGPTMLGVVASV